MNYSELKKLSVEDWELMQEILEYEDAKYSEILKSPKLQNIIKILASARGF